MSTFIDVRIPFEAKKHLGLAVNRTMETVKDWVLILDHDVLLVNPNWYYICLDAIERLGRGAGWITCVTNKIGSPLQKCSIDSKIEDMDYHYNYAKELYRKNYPSIVECTNEKHKFSGFFCLTHKEAWCKVMLTNELPASKFLGFDNWYYDRLKEAGYKTYVMKHLYVYHSYRRLWRDESWTKGIIGY